MPPPPKLLYLMHDRWIPSISTEGKRHGQRDLPSADESAFHTLQSLNTGAQCQEQIEKLDPYLRSLQKTSL